MVKACFKNLSLYIFGLIINCVIIELPPVMAQDTASTIQAANPSQIDLEPEILAEINRVRTNPQGYAQWLEQQRQYYDGIWLKFPGEKPIRTNKGLKALNEAIAILKQQQPLAALDTSDTTSATAQAKLNDFATANNIQHISYGRVTPQGIVMSIVVDELFPDRRRRKSLLSSEANDTGVICKPDPRYAKVCAIAYSNTEPAEVTPADHESTVANNTTEAVTPEAAEETTPETSQSENEPTNIPEPAANTEADNSDSEEIATAELPEPSQPETLPTPPVTLPTPEAEAEPEPEEATVETEAEAEPEPEEATVETEAEAEPESEVAETEPEPEEATVETEAEVEPESEVAETEPEPEEATVETEAEVEPELEVAETEPEPEPEEIEAEPEEIAINSENISNLNSTEQGALEDGDRTIPDDGSFYDSYPLEVKAGESFTVSLESDDFDPFVALIDDKGNIIEQNDDISEEDSNSKIEITIPADGKYNIIVNAYDEGGKGEYRLILSQ